MKEGDEVIIIKDDFQSLVGELCILEQILTKNVLYKYAVRLTNDNIVYNFAKGDLVHVIDVISATELLKALL